MENLIESSFGSPKQCGKLLFTVLMRFSLAFPFGEGGSPKG